jgi:small redox-active disulfide protein 2
MSTETKGGTEMKIEILGPGCQRCVATEENVRKALGELRLEAEVAHVSDPREFARRGVMFTPAVVVDGEVKASGRIPEVEEIRNWLAGRPAA